MRKTKFIAPYNVLVRKLAPRTVFTHKLDQRYISDNEAKEYKIPVVDDYGVLLSEQWVEVDKHISTDWYAVILLIGTKTITVSTGHPFERYTWHRGHMFAAYSMKGAALPNIYFGVLGPEFKLDIAK